MIIVRRKGPPSHQRQEGLARCRHGIGDVAGDLTHEVDVVLEPSLALQVHMRPRVVREAAPMESPPSPNSV
eukprot:740821-Pyramimonas_sp.AAC.1